VQNAQNVYQNGHSVSSVGLGQSPVELHIVGDPRALPVRDIPARSLAVAMADQTRSRRRDSCRV
jgi:hypothetical protein